MQKKAQPKQTRSNNLYTIKQKTQQLKHKQTQNNNLYTPKHKTKQLKHKQIEPNSHPKHHNQNHFKLTQTQQTKAINKHTTNKSTQHPQATKQT